MVSEEIMLLPLWYAVFLLSITCHEAAHAWAAHRGGDPTAYLGGQVSLNPLPHMQREPFGTVLVPLLSYLFLTKGWMLGWASAPYDPSWEDRYPRRAAWMAAAGPLSNLVLAAIGFAVLKAGLANETWMRADAIRLDRLVQSAGEGPSLLDGLGRLCSILLSMNLVLFLFNLFPLPPMDGASVLAGLFEPARRLRNMLRASPMAGLLGLVIAWSSFRYIFFPMYSLVLGWLFG